MANKYLKGGAINPAWADEQEADRITENILNMIESGCVSKLLFEAIGGVAIEIENPGSNYEPENKSNGNSLEEIFQFIKDHSDNEEDLKLAREIAGLD